MSLILHIDTAVDMASICLSDHDKLLALDESKQTRESAGWLQPAIQRLLHQCGVGMHQLAAVSVSAGPGSYTGLRVGMASAKGLCYALNIPLITVGTLTAMASAALAQWDQSDVLLCPMIDARRMEVFTAMYNRNLEELLAPQNMVVEHHSFDSWLEQHKVVFFGNGSTKVKDMLAHPHALFIAVASNAASLVPLAWQQFVQGQFAPLAYTEPMYAKAFYTPH